MGDYIWPEVFDRADKLLPFYPDEDEETRKALALATQLDAWGNCLAGDKAPANFGYVMAELGSITGAYTADDCMALAKSRKEASPTDTTESMG